MELVRCVIRVYDAGTHTAEVEVIEAPLALMSGLPVLADVAAAEMTVGRKCVVALWEDGNGVVIGPYD